MVGILLRRLMARSLLMTMKAVPMVPLLVLEGSLLQLLRGLYLLPFVSLAFNLNRAGEGGGGFSHVCER